MSAFLDELLLQWQGGARELRDLLAPVSPVLRRVDTYAVRPAGYVLSGVGLSYGFGLAWESCLIIASIAVAVAALMVGVICVPELMAAARRALPERTGPYRGRHRQQTRWQRVLLEAVVAVRIWWNTSLLGGVQ